MNKIDLTKLIKIVAIHPESFLFRSRKKLEEKEVKVKEIEKWHSSDEATGWFSVIIDGKKRTLRICRVKLANI